MTGEAFVDDDETNPFQRWYNFMPVVKHRRRTAPLRASREGTVDGRCQHIGCDLPCCK